MNHLRIVLSKIHDDWYLYILGSCIKFHIDLSVQGLLFLFLFKLFILQALFLKEGLHEDILALQNGEDLQFLFV
jgi:hypothetical protein